MVNRSKNRFTMKTKYGAAVAPVFVLAGAYVAWNYINHRLWRKKDDNNGRDIRKGIHNSISKETSLARRRKDQKTLSRSVSMGAIRGGKVALQRLLDLHSYHLDTSSLVNAEIEFESLLSKEKPDFGLLQVVSYTKSFYPLGLNLKSLEPYFLLPLVERHCEDGNEWKRSKRS